MATLQHGDKVSVYYNNNAFIQAYEAAADSGDVITLSAGRFTAPTYIQKGLSIIGNGFVTDTEEGIYPTVITTALRFKRDNTTDDDGEVTTETIPYDGTRLEGLYFYSNVLFSSEKPARNIQIIKCFTRFGLDLQTSITNLNIRQCRLEELDLYTTNLLENVYVANSYVAFSSGEKRTDHTSFFENCIFHQSNAISKCTANFENCIFDAKLPKEGSFVNNCIFMGITGNPTTGAGNWYSMKYAGIFEEEMTDLEWSMTKTYKLKYPETYIGTDGTQVGLYGGHYPFNPTPTTPQITECQIDDATATDGKLKVNITVEAQTED